MWQRHHTSGKGSLCTFPIENSSIQLFSSVASALVGTHRDCLIVPSLGQEPEIQCLVRVSRSNCFRWPSVTDERTEGWTNIILLLISLHFERPWMRVYERGVNERKTIFATQSHGKQSVGHRNYLPYVCVAFKRIRVLYPHTHAFTDVRSEAKSTVP